MARDVNEQSFNNNYVGGHAKFRKYHGGKLFAEKDNKQLKHIAHAEVKKEKPDVVLFQAGGNDLQNLTRPVNPISPLSLAQEIIGVGKLCSKYGATIVISGVLPRTEFYQNLKRWEVNILLRGLCAANNFTFIDHSNINAKEHLLKDGVHFNNVGTNLFTENIIRCLNDLST